MNVIVYNLQKSKLLKNNTKYYFEFQVTSPYPLITIPSSILTNILNVSLQVVAIYCSNFS